MANTIQNCPTCGNPVEHNAKVCGNCMTILETADPAQESKSRLNKALQEKNSNNFRCWQICSTILFTILFMVIQGTFKHDICDGEFRSPSFYTKQFCSEFMVPSNVSVIKRGAFTDCRIKFVGVPENVTYIEPGAFDNEIFIVGKSGGCAETYVRRYGGQFLGI